MPSDDDPIDAEWTDVPWANVELDAAHLRQRREQEAALALIAVDGEVAPQVRPTGEWRCPSCGVELETDTAVIDIRRGAHRFALCVGCHETWLSSTPGDIFAALGAALRLARRAHLPATLTKDQWQRTVDHFANRCAYCDGPWSVIEHATSVKLGGGTTETNCLPACIPCNVRKGARRLEDWDREFDDGRALAWLRSLGR